MTQIPIGSLRQQSRFVPYYFYIAKKSERPKSINTPIDQKIQERSYDIA